MRAELKHGEQGSCESNTAKQTLVRYIYWTEKEVTKYYMS